MAEEQFFTCTYRILRYVPNLLRDEWVNIGVLLVDPGGRLCVRLLQEEADFARLRRLFPETDVPVLRALQANFETEAGRPAEAAALVARLEETLSNALQLGPQKAVLTTHPDAQAELERIYLEQVAPPAFRPVGAEGREPNHGFIRSRAWDTFKRLGIRDRIQSRIEVSEFTAPGDPFRLDFGWSRNGGSRRGFLHSVALGRDTGQAKVLAFTAAAVREKLPYAEFAAITEMAPQAGNRRHEFAASLLEASRIQVVPLGGLDEYARDLRTRLM